MDEREWGCVPCSEAELNLAITLTSGQAFRWKETQPGQWTGVFRGYAWTLKQDADHLYYKVHNKNHDLSAQQQQPAVDQNPDLHTKTEDLDLQQILSDYFRLHVNLSELYKQWCDKDSYFKCAVSNIKGVRMLRQEPVENLFTFICSSNNNISRITGMVNNLCVNYGEALVSIEGEQFYKFPTLESVSGSDVEAKLRGLGFGYRAKYISETAKKIIKEHGKEAESWLYSLREQPYESVRKELLKFTGVGGKVADCVALMSLDKLETVPIDTHIWQVAAKHYMPKLQQKKTLTSSLYKEIGDLFRDVWGSYAGWAQAVLFSSELKHIKVQTSPTKSQTKKQSGDGSDSSNSKKSRKKIGKRTNSKVCSDAQIKKPKIKT